MDCIGWGGYLLRRRHDQRTRDSWRLFCGWAIHPLSATGAQSDALALAAHSNLAASGRQDSNLRPLVPQTSPHFPMSAEFDLEWFRRELVGMRTSAFLVESVGLAVPISASHLAMKSRRAHSEFCGFSHAFLGCRCEAAGHANYCGSEVAGHPFAPNCPD
jgi:hypothetical protein